jgi:hypothetical protein
MPALISLHVYVQPHHHLQPERKIWTLYSLLNGDCTILSVLTYKQLKSLENCKFTSLEPHNDRSGFQRSMAPNIYTFIILFDHVNGILYFVEVKSFYCSLYNSFYTSLPFLLLFVLMPTLYYRLCLVLI